MKCFYINLDSATERRKNLEASFRATAPAHWELIRVAALGPADVGERPGSITPPEKGCFLSHRAAIAATADTEEPVFIVEDDTRFSARTFATLEGMLAKTTDWDLLYTDVTFTDAATMLACAKRYARLSAAGQFLLKDLAEVSFAAAAAYLVRGSSKAKVLAEIDAAGLDAPYDILLRRLVRAGKIGARVTTPFLTTLSADAMNSSIQSARWKLRDGMVAAYRNLLFVDRDLTALTAQIAQLEESCADPAARLAGQIFGVMASEAFPDKW